MKQKHFLVAVLGSLLTLGISHANELQLSKPRVVSYLDSPLVVEVPVKAAPGQRLAVPCISGVEVNGQTRKNATKKYAFWRTGPESGVIQLRDEQWVKQSPMRLELETGCAEAKKTSFELAVAAAPIIPVSATPSATKKTSKNKKTARNKKPAAVVAKADAAASNAAAAAASTAAADDGAKPARAAQGTKAPPADVNVSAKNTENAGVDASVLLDRVPNMSRPSQR